MSGASPPRAENPGQESREKKMERHEKQIDVADLERRVLLAELHAREAEAEVRYLEASAKRKALKGARKDEMRIAKKAGRKKRDRPIG